MSPLLSRYGVSLLGLAVLLSLGCAAAPAPAVAAAGQAAAAEYDFDIPAQPLARTLNRIGQVAGLSVLVEGDGATLVAPPLSGRMTLDAALRSVLPAGRGRHRFTAQGSLVVELPAPADEAAPTVTLKTVVVTATGYPQQLADAPATMTVVGAGDLARRPGPTLAEALRDVPGLFVGAPARDGGTPITLRGMGQPYVLFMIDGKPLSASEEAAYNGRGVGAKAGFLPPVPAIDRIEVIRGPMSALYGSAASGGVVNVITRPVPDAWTGRLDLGLTHDLGPGGANEARFMLGGPLVRDRLGLMLYGSRHRQDGAVAPSSSGRRANLGGRLGWTPAPDQSLELDLWGSRLRLDEGGPAAPAPTVIRDRGTSLTHRLRRGDEAETVSFLFRETTDFDAGNRSGHEALTFGTRSTQPWGRHHLTFGFEHRHERTRHDPGRLPDSAVTDPGRWHQALYAEGRLALSPDLTLTLGLRHDRNQRYGAQLTPRAYAVWRPLPGLTIKGGFGSGYRVPALKQADDGVWEPSGGDGRSRDRGNSALKPERSSNYELGLVWEGQTGLQFGATAFYTRFRDRIGRVDLCRTPAGQAPACVLNGAHYVAVTQYRNQDEARLRGVELTLDIPLGDATVSANYTWSDSRIASGRNAGQPFHNLPRHMLNLALDWQPDEALNLWARARYRSTSQALGRTAGLRAHLVVDLGLDYRLREGVTGAIGLYNVANVVPDESMVEGRRLYLGLSNSF